MASVKGSQVLGVVKALRYLRSTADLDVPPHLERYFANSDRLIVAAWYPDEDLRDLMLLLGHAIAPSIEGDPWLYIGRSGAERDFSGAKHPSARVKMAGADATFVLAWKGP